MAIYCDSCKRIYGKYYANCPKCGEALKQDERTNETLLNEGFILFSAKKAAPAPNSTKAPNVSPIAEQTDVFKIDDSDTLKEIQGMFDSMNGGTNTAESRTTATTSNTTAQTPIGNAARSFFENPNDEAFNIDDIESVGSDRPQHNANIFSEAETDANANPRPYTFNARRRSPLNTRGTRPNLRIPWRLISRIAIILGIVFVVIAILSNIDVILQGAANLIPLILLGVLIFYILRSIITGR